MNYWLIFITGLTTGGISCVALQGGLLAGVITNQKEVYQDKLRTKDWQMVAVFLLAKLIIHTIFGFLLGALGSIIYLSSRVRITFQIFTALFMFATAMNLLDVHPFFRKFALQPPKFVYKYLKNTTKTQSLFAPALLGFLTIFVPCGVTQAMEILAINSGSAASGALTLAAFVLGTSPIFFLIGIATAKLSENLKQTFYKVAAIVLIFMSLYGINGALVAIDSPISWNKLTQNIFSSTVEQKAEINVQGNVQKVTIHIYNNGYDPRNIVLKAGIPVELTLVTNNTYSCASSFMLREFGISTVLKPSDSQTFRFTPQKSGNFGFSCSMGMYTGTLKVE